MANSIFPSGGTGGTVSVDDGLDGDGSVGDPLDVLVDGVTIIINGSNQLEAVGGGGAPTDATYITQTANGGLSAEQALSTLATGLMRVATTTGVITSLTDSAGLAANISDETGTGALVFANTPTLVTPILGTPTSGTLTNATGLPLTTGVTGTLPIANVGTLPAAGMSVTFDGGGATLSTGVQLDVEMPFACTLTAARLLADQTGSIVVDIWKDTYGNYPPTDADSITSATPPTITTAVKSEDTTLSSWITSVSAGDTLRFNIDSVTAITRCTLSLRYTRT